MEFLEVVLDVQVVVAEVMLADDRVEEVKSPGHPPARLGRQVALRIDQGIAVLAHRGVEHPGDEHLETVEIPGLPVLVLEAEHRPPPKNALDVDPEHLLEVLVKQSEHLERLVHFDRPLLQTVIITQRGHATDMDAGHRRATEIHGHLVRLLVCDGIQNSLPTRRDSGSRLKGGHRGNPHRFEGFPPGYRRPQAGSTIWVAPPSVTGDGPDESRLTSPWKPHRALSSWPKVLFSDLPFPSPFSPP